MKRGSFLKATSTLVAGGFLINPGMAQERNNMKTQSIETDILVCGGGPAGIAAATLAGRIGKKSFTFRAL